MTSLVRGDLQVHPESHIAGWCMLLDEPMARATVDVMVDGHYNMRLVAAARGKDPGDGRHGFFARLPMPIEQSGTRVIEAREVRTGAVFGRVVLFPERIAQTLTDRLEALDCAPLRHPMIGAPNHFRPALLKGFRELALELRERSGAVWRQEAQLVARRAPTLRLSQTPAVSFIVPVAATLEATLVRLAHLRTMCAETAAELLVVDDGADPRAVLLPTLIEGLRYSREADRRSGNTLNELALATRGDMLCFTAEETPAAIWELPWRAMRDTANTIVHLGPALDAAIAPFQPVWRPVAQRSTAHGVALALTRERFMEAGGFDPFLRGEAAFADLAQKCGVLGTSAIIWRYQLASGPRLRVQHIAGPPVRFAGQDSP